jgi:nucleotide-binding universal stress UspA family protein
MKVLIGHDGSESSDAIINDLRRAGLPRGTEAIVASAADLLMSSPTAAEIVEAGLTSLRVAAYLEHAQTHADRVVKEAEGSASAAAEKLSSHFPAWSVSQEVLTGSPAWELIDAADRLNADLLVVGSKGRSAINRLLLGGVSKRVATDARCSVRVARETDKVDEDPIRIIVGVDGSPAAEQAIFAVGQRVWAAGTEVHLIAVNDFAPPPTRVTTLLPQAADMLNSYFLNRESRVQSMLDWATNELGNVGLKTFIVLKEGEPGKVLINEAQIIDADSIFVGTRDFSNAFERLRLGSVSTAVVTHAHCSVEIVRPPIEQSQLG